MSDETSASPPAPEESPGAEPGEDVGRGVAHHLTWAWGALLVFLSLGLVLEALHGFKVGFYMDVSSSTRRLMWTLSHTHGTLFGLLHAAFAFTLSRNPAWATARRRLASTLLDAATILLPAGFFFGGVWIYDGDPGLPILLVPLGGLLAIGAAALTFLGVRAAK